MTPMVLANRSAGARSEHMAIVAVMLTPQPTPARARNASGSHPASLTRWKSGVVTSSSAAPATASRLPPRRSIIRPNSGRMAMATTL